MALLALAVAAPQRADAAAAGRRRSRYLERAQNADGGFGPAPGAGSTQMHTGWAALGLAAAGRNPRDVERGGRSLVDYMSANVARLRGDLGERSRTILALRAAGASPARLGGRDLLGELVRAQEADGSFAGLVNTTAFAVLALRAAGRPATRPRGARAARAFIAGQANADGGFNFAGKGGPSGADDTGAALQALAAAGRQALAGGAARGALARARPRTPTAASRCRAGRATRSRRRGRCRAWSPPAATRRACAAAARARRSRYLRSLVGSDGAIRYSRTSTQTPVWVTAQALTALAGKALPLARRGASAARATARRAGRRRRTPRRRAPTPPAPEAEPATGRASQPRARRRRAAVPRRRRCSRPRSPALDRRPGTPRRRARRP